MSAADQPATTSLTGISAPPPTSGGRAWLGSYLRRIILADLAGALAAGELAAQARFSWMAVPLGYDGLMCVLPLLWVAAVGLASGYDSRFIGLGSDEFRKVLNAAVGLTVMLGLVSYVGKLEIARGYLVVALPVTCCLNLCARFVLRSACTEGVGWADALSG